MKKIFSINFYFFIFFIILLLLEGIYSGFHYKVSALISFIPFKNIAYINPLIWNENGLVEIIQSIFLLIAIFYFFNFLRHSLSKHRKSVFTFFLYFYFIGLIYYFFEEISWGQHLFQWDSPKFFLEFNDQNETNLHNTSNLFNELPRTILLIWCSFSYIIHSSFSKNKKLNEFIFFIFPNKNLKKISFLLIFFVFPDLVVDKLNLHPGHPVDYTTHIRLYEIVDFLSFNFIRLSELHELILDYYILVHSFYLSKNIELSSKG